MKNIFLLLITAIIFAACTSGSDDSTPVTPVKSSRTVMFYFNSENNLYDQRWPQKDLAEIVTASKNVDEDVNILVFFDDKSTHKSYIYKIYQGEKKIVKDYGENIDASSPDNMLEIFQTMVNRYPASEYVTLFWGHGTGPWITKETSEVVAKSYGMDYNGGTASSATWINIPDMAKVLKQLPKQKMIMFDACLMQSVEIDYELKDCADYIVASSSETPSFSANFTTITPILASTKADDLPKAAIDDYTGQEAWASHSYEFTNVVMSAVKTSELDNLFNVTKSVLGSLSPIDLKTTFPADSHGATNCIFYFRENSYYGFESTYTDPIFHDMKDVMRHNLSETDFNNWCQAFDKVVVYKNSDKLKTIDIRNNGVKDWISNLLSLSDFRSFYVDDETCGALSMYIPDNTTRQMNTTKQEYKWWQKLMP